MIAVALTCTHAQPKELTAGETGRRNPSQSSLEVRTRASSLIVSQMASWQWRPEGGVVRDKTFRVELGRGVWRYSSAVFYFRQNINPQKAPFDPNSPFSTKCHQFLQPAARCYVSARGSTPNPPSSPQFPLPPNNGAAKPTASSNVSLGQSNIHPDSNPPTKTAMRTPRRKYRVSAII